MVQFIELIVRSMIHAFSMPQTQKTYRPFGRFRNLNKSDLLSKVWLSVLEKRFEVPEL